jgi:predicted SnoaL-like aldol condensation-catalyzing enzyme
MPRPTLALLAATASLLLAACAQTPPAGPLAQQEANRRAVLAFYEKGLNQKDADAALQYVGPRYVQHNPTATDGPEGFRKFIAFLRDKYPQSHSEIVRSFAEGDYVILHVHAVREPGTRGNAIVDIFKLENGKIVEHWDVTQPVPEKTVSGNSMF